MSVSQAKAGAAASGSGLSMATLTLTDAEIKALPTSTAPIIGPTPLASQILIPVSMVAVVTRAGGFGYLNLDANANLGITYVNALCSAIGPTSMLVRQQGALAFGAGVVTNPTSIRGGSGDSLVNAMAATALASIAGLPMRVVLNNAASGNLTSGGGANSAKIYVAYFTLTL